MCASRTARPACGLAVLVLVGLLGVPSPVAAGQDGASSGDGQTDVWDWLKRLRKKDTPDASTAVERERRRLHVILVPIIASKPSTGVTFGGGASFEFPLGDVDRTRVSSVLASASVSTRKFFSTTARLSLFGPGNQWAFAGDNHFQKTGQGTYGFGTDTTGSDAIDTRFTSIKFVDTWLRRIGRQGYAGVGFQFQRQSDIRPQDAETTDWSSSPFVTYSTRFGFDPASQTSAGMSVSLRHDSRDNVSDPSKGWYADTTFRGHFADFLGGDSTWQRLLFDARAYKGLGKGGRDTLALWGYGDVVTAGRAPYFALPATGTDPQGRSGRGYAEGRFRGDRLVYGEAEYRLSLRRDGLVGMVAFLNATSVGSSFDDEPLFESVAFGGGFGFRLRLEKRSRTNLCLDFGFGRDGSRGVYIALAEAF